MGALAAAFAFLACATMMLSRGADSSSYSHGANDSLKAFTSYLLQVRPSAAWQASLSDRGRGVGVASRALQKRETDGRMRGPTNRLNSPTMMLGSRSPSVKEALRLQAHGARQLSRRDVLGSVGAAAAAGLLAFRRAPALAITDSLEMLGEQPQQVFSALSPQPQQVLSDTTESVQARSEALAEKMLQAGPSAASVNKTRDRLRAEIKESQEVSNPKDDTASGKAWADLKVKREALKEAIIKKRTELIFQEDDLDAPQEDFLDGLARRITLKLVADLKNDIEKLDQQFVDIDTQMDQLEAKYRQEKQAAP